MKIITYTLLISLLLFSCNTQAIKERKIKKTVENILNAIEKNSTNQCMDLIKDSKGSYGSINMQVHFLNRNYKKINSQIDLRENIKVKDTIYVGAKMQYVQYKVVNNNANYVEKPLLITFIFYDQEGYDKIFNSSFVENFLDWE
ncbi:hypothetical protein [Epilithonimonas hispanica]|uniref:DUF4878 domain-containing protein n=1 Tax=Epilithonimonas hispanica TaxID=358687 RepID=A0A3D9CLN6_9FLAO|nr:hypothetical protein [Epilithonimonas hispanica]REC66653.1 hypothetical protein DRF58_16180 [Epilithonimonas hispanica]REC66661.1 hypothetical protein DRF58_16220 [Epilithonimonas hispanica]